MVSIIVPLYNVEDNCGFCIRSLLSQTYKDIEIILVDDGSTDGTYALCESYAEQDNRIRLIQQENNGVSAARNAGLNSASGEFIMFADGDDIVSPKYVEQLLSLLEPSDAMATCAFARISDYEKSVFSENINVTERRNSSDCLELLLQARFPVSVCGSICRANRIKECKFPVGIKNNEDKYFVFQCLLKNLESSIIRTDAVLYDYYVRQGSATTTGFNGNMDTVIIADRMCTEIASTRPELESLARKNALNARISIMHSVVMKKKNYPDIYRQLKNEILDMSKEHTLGRQAQIEVAALKMSDGIYKLLVCSYYKLMPNAQRYKRNDQLMKLSILK